MDSVENLNLKLDSTLRLANSLLHMGQDCFMTSPSNLSWQSKSLPKLLANVNKLEKGKENTAQVGAQKTVDLADINAVHMRKDPPFDGNYLACTWVLSELEKQAFIFNHPSTLRDLNEKVSVFSFPEYTLPAILSADPKAIETFICEACDGDAIVKPLDLFGGRGVERLEAKGPGGALTAEISSLFSDGQIRIVQPFDKAIFDGEVRAFTAGGRALSWSLKVPAKGEFLANTRMGATIEPYQPTSEESAMVAKVSQSLLDKGVYFVGYDLIGGKISEINITSPRLLVAPGEEERPIYDRMAEDLINYLDR